MSLLKSLSDPKFGRRNSIDLFWVLILFHTKLDKEVTTGHAPGFQRPGNFTGGETENQTISIQQRRYLNYRVLWPGDEVFGRVAQGWGIMKEGSCRKPLLN